MLSSNPRIVGRLFEQEEICMRIYCVHVNKLRYVCTYCDMIAKRNTGMASNILKFLVESTGAFHVQILDEYWIIFQFS